MPATFHSRLLQLTTGLLCLGGLSAVHAQNPIVPEAAAPVAIEIPDGEGAAKTWVVKASAGLSSKSGNTDSDSYQARLETEQTFSKTLIRFLAEGNYAEAEITTSDGVRETTQTAGSARINLNIKQRFSRFYAYLDGIAFHDTPADIRFRGIASTGLGTFLADTDTLKISVDGGLAHVAERTRAEHDDYLALRLANRIDYIPSKSVSLWQTAEYLPQAEDFSNHLITTEFGISSALTRSLSLNVILQIAYDSDPATETDSTDRTLTAQVAVSF